MADDVLDGEDSVEYVDEVKAILFEIKVRIRNPKFLFFLEGQLNF